MTSIESSELAAKIVEAYRACYCIHTDERVDLESKPGSIRLYCEKLTDKREICSGCETSDQGLRCLQKVLLNLMEKKLCDLKKHIDGLKGEISVPESHASCSEDAISRMINKIENGLGYEPSYFMIQRDHEKRWIFSINLGLMVAPISGSINETEGFLREMLKAVDSRLQDQLKHYSEKIGSLQEMLAR